MTHCYYIQKEIWGYIVQPRTSLTHCKWPQFSIRLNSLIQVIWPKLGKGGLRNNKWTYCCMELWYFTAIICDSHKTIYKSKLDKLHPKEDTHLSTKLCYEFIPLQFHIQDDNCAAFLSIQFSLAAQVPIRLNDFPVSEYVYNACMHV